MPRALRSVASSSTMPERPPSAALPRATSPGSSPPSRISRPPSVRRFVINDAGAATVRGAAASDVTWQFTAIPDKPPTIALAKEPEGQARGALQLSYKLEDDYGVIGADRKSTRLNSSHSQISYAVFCLKKKTTPQKLPNSRASVGDTAGWPNASGDYSTSSRPPKCSASAAPSNRLRTSASTDEICSSLR